jgi:hypothetical protein
MTPNATSSGQPLAKLASANHVKRCPHPMLKPLFNAQDDEWVVKVGRYMLNMGVIEAASRLLIVGILHTEIAPIFKDELTARIGFIRKKFPRENNARHQWAMNVLKVANKLAGFRNIVAHSPLVITGHADGTFRIQGIMNLTPTFEKIITGDL